MSDTSVSEPSTAPVCVTGASGFIGSHLVSALLEQGHHVRATVRDASDESKTAHLRALDPGGRLSLYSADLMVDGAFDEAIKGCSTVYHIASAVYLTADDPQREIIDPAVKGTRNVFDAIARSPSVQRVGLTSSIAAVVNTAPRPDHTYTEADWVEDASVEDAPYPLSKRLAEEAAWSAHNAAGKRYSLTVVNPVLVTGPVMTRVHVRSSPSVIRDLMRGTFKGCPNLGFGVVDVRDVVAALLAGVGAEKTGRYILYAEHLWMRDIAQTIAGAFPDRRVPTRKLPNLVMYIAALFDKRLTWAFLKRNLGVRHRIDNRKVREELGIELRDARESVIDTCRSFVDHGFVR